MSIVTCGILGNALERKQKAPRKNTIIHLSFPDSLQTSPFDALGPPKNIRDEYELYSTFEELEDSMDGDLFYSCLSFDIKDTTRNAGAQHGRHIFVDPEVLAEGTPQYHRSVSSKRSQHNGNDQRKRAPLQVLSCIDCCIIQDAYCSKYGLQQIVMISMCHTLVLSTNELQGIL